MKVLRIVISIALMQAMGHFFGDLHQSVQLSMSLLSVFVFSNARGNEGNVLDKRTGRILSTFNMKYACTRFTVSGNYLLGTNLDMIDLGKNNELVASGPCIDSRECVGATVSNGRVFYTSQASGLQVSLTAGEEAKNIRAPWEK